MLSKRRAKLVALLVICGLSGCGPAQPQIAPTAGTVKFHGKPLEHGTVVFHPPGGTPTAQGQIQADGSFLLTTFKADDGAVVGQNTVTVEVLGEGHAPSPIPAKYRTPHASPLKVEVVPGENHFALELQD